MRGDEPAKYPEHNTNSSEFPTCVGMNRDPNAPISGDTRVPHMRGDEPVAMAAQALLAVECHN